MAKLYNLARMATATTGTGTMALGAAASGYLTFAQSGVQNGDVVTYAIEDGTNREVGRGTYSTTGPTLSRDTVLVSTNSNAKISLSGSAQVFITAAAEDFPLANRPTSSMFSIELGGSASIKDSITDDPYDGMVMLGICNSSALSWVRSKAIVNASSWSFIARLRRGLPQINYNGSGLFVYASGQSGMAGWGLGSSNGAPYVPAEQISRMPQSGSGFTANDFVGTGYPGLVGECWQKIVYDGTNLKFFLSRSRVFSATAHYSAVATTLLGAAPTHLGFGMYVGTTTNTTERIMLTCDHIETTAW